MLISYNWLKEFIPNLTESSADVAEALSLSLAEVESMTKVDDDTILEIENKALSHRPDLFSQLGMAREVTAALGLGKPSIEPRRLNVAQPSPGGHTNLKIDLKIKNKVLCPRYMAMIIDNLKIGESPKWMQERLKSLGQKSINNIVDVTNYVMHELGQPVHAFGMENFQISNHKLQIGVRQARKGEILETIDGVERELDGGELVVTSTIQPSNNLAISDVPIALAGIMGGADTQVTENTTTILLESANFNMYRVRQTSKTLGLRTEASTRFEKGLDPNLAEEGLRRCIQLLKEIATAQVTSEVTDVYPTPVKPVEIDVDLEAVRNFLGANLSDEEITDYWQRLDLNVSHSGTEASAGVIESQPSHEKTLSSLRSSRVTATTIQIPTHRRDLTIPEDLYEEAARLHGYNNFKPTLPVKPIAPPLENKEWQFANQVREVLVGLGLDEILTYSFVDTTSVTSEVTLSSFVDTTSVTSEVTLSIQNPIAPEMSYLRTSLLSSVGEKVVENTKRFNEFGLFEIGKVSRVADADSPNHEARIMDHAKNSRVENLEETNNSDNLPHEPKMLAIAYYSKNKSESDVYLYTKGILETLLKALHIVTPRKTPDVFGLTSGVGELAQNTYGFEIELATLQELAMPVEFSPIPAHMPTYQDLSFIVDEDVPVGNILKIIHDVGEGIPLQDLELIDVYQSDQLKKKSQKSITVRLEFLDPEGPLSDREVSPFREKIEEKLKEKFDAEIR